MGNLNCKTCDCTHILEKQQEVNTQSDLTYEPSSSLPSMNSEIGKSTPKLSLSPSLAHLKPVVPKLVAVWRGYSVRKLVRHLKRQNQPNHAYFSKQEIFETLSNKIGFPTRRQNRKPYRYKSGAIYTGLWLGGFRDGYGTMEWPDGAKYEGNWAYSKPSGFGKFTHVDGDVYEGEWKREHVAPKDTFGSGGNLAKWKDIISDGFCKNYIVWLWLKQEMLKNEANNKSTAKPLSENQVKRQPQQPSLQIKTSQTSSTASVPSKLVLQSHNSQPNQEESPRRTTIELRGMDSTNSKMVQINQEIQNIKEKIDTISLPSAGLLAGERTFMQYRYDNGTIYLGEWRNNMRDGKGKQIWTSGDSYEGEWLNDKQHGIGKTAWASGNQYIGNYFQDEKQGIGEYIWEDKSVYVGEWKRNRMCGVGKHKWANGREYIGEWLDGVRHGYGCMTYRNGSKYEGEFKKDKQDGAGILREADGRVMKGVWKDGKFIKPAE